MTLRKVTIEDQMPVIKLYNTACIMVIWPVRKKTTLHVFL